MTHAVTHAFYAYTDEGVGLRLRRRQGELLVPPSGDRVLFEGTNEAVPRDGWHDTPGAARDAAWGFYVRQRDDAVRALARVEGYLKDLERDA